MSESFAPAGAEVRLQRHGWWPVDRRATAVLRNVEGRHEGLARAGRYSLGAEMHKGLHFLSGKLRMLRIDVFGIAPSDPLTA